MKTIIKYFKQINTLIMIFIMVFIALSENSNTRYLIVSCYLVVLLLFMSYYIIKIKPIKKSSIISEIILLCVFVVWLIYIVFKLIL
ncbi:hypothetical protein CBE01nite_34730 [Clostridium beijerinckii]|nr:CHASE2 domain-containing sensor protein [Clostridium beijerinckii]NYB99394.1 CHASE2 domain-containing sensor protein [Clostridium beijerinckii]OOM21597.1 hypothetical protein CLBEI_37300 [Clostridium beijerinckii]GEP65705.1 hypothetical protein CBE01nite_34730 [Clostridium beijerinckii]SQB20300.1 Uncharacterised protein [Clostridium beijerinckii]